MLLEVGKTAAKRGAARVDDACVRQHQVDEPQVQEVAPHLVDEMRPAEQPMRARLRKIAFPERGALGARQTRDRLRVGRGLTRFLIPVPELQGNAEHVGQLARTFHLRMTGEDLLEQRRAGAWQADDEDRLRRWAAPAGACGEKLPRVERRGALHETRHALALIVNHGPSQLVASGIVLEGSGEVARHPPAPCPAKTRTARDRRGAAPRRASCGCIAATSLAVKRNVLRFASAIQASPDPGLTSRHLR